MNEVAIVALVCFRRHMQQILGPHECLGEHKEQLLESGPSLGEWLPHCSICHAVSDEASVNLLPVGTGLIHEGSFIAQRRHTAEPSNRECAIQTLQPTLRYKTFQSMTESRYLYPSASCLKGASGPNDTRKDYGMGD